MLFNSVEFFLFLPPVFALYWALAKGPLKLQNLFLIAASYVFYGWWDWRFLLLIVASSAVDYLIGLAIDRTRDRRARRSFLAASLAANLGLLFTFKYYGFFADSAAAAMRELGLEPSFPTLEIILPVGISFYTFQTLSYTIDVYQKKTAATRDPVAFFAFVCFFPQLVAGPIERSGFLAQFLERREFDETAARDGCRQMLWGLFKKVVVADSIAPHVSYIFENHGDLPGPVLLVGSWLFAIQLYGDFSGYSDIAIGTARLFGFSLRRNFHYPLFATSIGDFWSRWHISLTTWFRDYVFRPLYRAFRWPGGAAAAVMAAFAVSGLWHGANWTFVSWGVLNGGLFLVSAAWKRGGGRAARGRAWSGLSRASRSAWTFVVLSLALVLFRSESMPAAVGYLAGVPLGWDHWPSYPAELSKRLDDVAMVIGLIVQFGLEWVNQDFQHGLSRLPESVFLRWALYWLLALAGLQYVVRPQEFIYFQF